MESYNTWPSYGRLISLKHNDFKVYPFCNIWVLHFSWLNNIDCTGIKHFVYSEVDGHLGCFNLLTIMNNGGMGIHVQVFVRTYIFYSLGYITKSKIAESYGNSMFHILRNCQTFSEVADSFYISTYDGSNFSNTCYYLSFW